MASLVTQFYFLQDPPIGGGNDWEVIIVGPSGGNAEVSFDNGTTWLQANQGYEATYGGYRYRPPCYGTLGCTDPRQPSGVVLGRMVGETDSVKAVFGAYRDSLTDDVYEFAFSAVCVGGNISLNFLSQYSQSGPNNYQLDLAKTQTLRLSINGTPLGILTQQVDSCPVATCHYSQVYSNIVVPVANFPLTAVFSDSANVLRVSTQSISLVDFGNPCVAAPNPTANAVNDAVGNQTIGNIHNILVGANDTPCDIGTSTWTLISGSQVNVTVNSFLTSGSVNYTPTALGAFSFQYEIRCNGVVIDTATVSGTGVASCVNVTNVTIAGDSNVFATVAEVYTATPNGDAPHVYTWSVTNGTINSGQGTSTVNVTFTASGSIGVTVTNCGGSGSDSDSLSTTLITANAVNDIVTTAVNTAVVIQMAANDTLCN